MGRRGSGRWLPRHRRAAPAGRCGPDGSSALSIADRYRLYIEFEVRDAPTYRTIAEHLVTDDRLLSLLEPLPTQQKQPNLFFGAVNHLGGIDADYATFRSFVLDRWDDVLALLQTRTTQTNEVGRCATLLPALGLLQQPLALIEVGASAGLNLLLDRFAYDYGDGRKLGDAASTVVVPCELRGEVPLPDKIPEVVWRRGIDLEPIDVHDDGSVRWLESCVFFDHADRLARLRGAIDVARRDAPVVIKADLIDALPTVVEEAPKDATIVVFHSAVLGYLERDRRAVFTELVGELPVVWLSNELAPLVPSLQSALHRTLPDELCFLLGRNGTEPLALTHHHGRWMEWIAEA